MAGWMERARESGCAWRGVGERVMVMRTTGSEVALQSIFIPLLLLSCLRVCRESSFVRGQDGDQEGATHGPQRCWQDLDAIDHLCQLHWCVGELERAWIVSIDSLAHTRSRSFVMRSIRVARDTQTLAATGMLLLYAAAAADRVSGGERLELTVSLCSRGLAGSRTVPRQPDAQPLGLWRVRAAAASSSSSSWLDAHELVVLHIWSCIWHVRAARRRSWTRTFSARRRTSSATWRC